MPHQPIHIADYHFVLNCFSPTDIDGVIEDMELHIQGYKFLYALDTYDIMENYLPYIQLELFTKHDRNFQAQKFVCYDYFFGGANKTNCILLNEYKVELVAAKNKLIKYLKDAKTVLKNLADLKKDTDNFINDPKKSESFLRNHFEVILLLLILNKKTYRILDEFFLFIKTRLDISQIQVLEEKHRKDIEDIFALSDVSRYAATLFKEYIDQNRQYLISVKSKDELHIYLENTFRDVQAIERLIKINHKVESAGLKYSVVYLSSAHKSREIFKAAAVLDRQVKNEPEFPTHSFHRNIFQFFLFDRIKNEFRESPQSAIVVLRDLREVLSRLNAANSEDSRSFDGQVELLDMVNRLFDEKSSVLDNHFYFSVYEKYKKTLGSLLEDKAEYALNVEEVNQIIVEVDKNSDEYRSKIFSLEFALSQINQTFEVVDSLSALDYYEPEYRFGKDIVRNPYHHLPILVLWNDGIYPSLRNKLNTFLNLNVEVSDNEKPLLQMLFKDVVGELYKLDGGNLYSKFIKSYVITYLNFVAQGRAKNRPLKDAQENPDISEEKILFDLEKQYEIIKYQFQRVNYEKIQAETKIEYVQEDYDLLTEIVYTLLWLYRRNLREDEGIEKGLGLIELGVLDPRIYQGIGLCFVSKVYDIDQIMGVGGSKGKGEKLDKAIYYMELARTGYRDRFKNQGNGPAGILFSKNYIAVLNSLADLYVKKYSTAIVPMELEFLVQARSCINDVKKIFDQINLEYDDHPVYSATEVEIEYYEALSLYENNQRNAAHKKIISATLRASMFRKVAKSDPYVDESYFKINERLNKLAHRIFDNI